MPSLRRAHFLPRLERFCEQYRYAVLGIWSLLYFASTCYLATRKLLWFDEIYSFYMSAVPRFADLWRAVTHGVDYNPPLFYLLTRVSQIFFGHTELGTRMPEILGFWLFSICLYRFVATRTTTLAGLISLSFPATTTAYYYAYEARPQGIVLGLAGLALTSWQAATQRPTRRSVPLFVLAVSLAAALLCHSYAFVIFTPIVLGEVVRFRRLRRPDWALWSALLIGASAVLVSIPLLLSARHYLPVKFAKRYSAAFFGVYPNLLGGSVAILCLAVALYCVSCHLRRRSDAIPDSGFQSWELAALIGCLLVPIVVTAAALVTGAPVQMRFSLLVVAGTACLLGTLLRRSPLSAVLCILFAVGLYLKDLRELSIASFFPEPSSGLALYLNRADLESLYSWMRTDPHHDLPILLLGPYDFAQILFYAPADLKTRLVYSLSLWPHPGYFELQKCCGAPGRILPDNITVFLAYGRADTVMSVRQLWRDGAAFSLEKPSKDEYLWLVHYDTSRMAHQIGSGPEQ